MGIAAGKRNIGAATRRSGKKCTGNIDQFQSVIGENQFSSNAIERKRLAEKDVIHSARRIDVNVETGVLAAAKLVNTIGGNIRRLMEFVGNDVFVLVRLDPINRVGWTKRAFEI